MFYSGQKVVRIGSIGARKGSVVPPKYSAPRMGDVVTVLTINSHSDCTLLTFREHDNRHLVAAGLSRIEPGFDARCFRPLAEPKADISIFRKALVGDLITEET